MLAAGRGWFSVRGSEGADTVVQIAGVDGVDEARLAHRGGEHEPAVTLAGADFEDFRAGGDGPHVVDDVDAVEALGHGDGELLVGVDVEAG